MIDVFVLLSQKFYLLLKQAISDRFRILFNICKEFSCISLYSLSPPSEVKLFSKVRNGNDFESVKPMNNGSGLSELHQGNLCINQHQSIILILAPSYPYNIISIEPFPFKCFNKLCFKETAKYVSKLIQVSLLEKIICFGIFIFSFLANMVNTDIVS